MTAAAVTAVISMDELLPWYLGALGELHATLDALGVRASGPEGGTFARELFTDERGEATVFVPTATEIQRLGRVEPVVVPAAELAVIVHSGSLADVDRAYGALAAHVASHALQVDGPILEASPCWPSGHHRPKRVADRGLLADLQHRAGRLNERRLYSCPGCSCLGVVG